MEKGKLFRNLSKLNWKRDLYGVKVQHRVKICEKYQEDKKCQSCVSDLKFDCIHCELVKSCIKCFNRITQKKLYITEVKLKRLPPNKHGYVITSEQKKKEKKKRKNKLRLVLVNAVNVFLKGIMMNILKIEKYVKVVTKKTEENNCSFFLN